MWHLALFVIIFIVGRICLKKYIFERIGQGIGVDGRRLKAPVHPKLETAYQLSDKLDQKTLQFLTIRLELSEEQVKLWWRLRKGQDKPSDLEIFSEGIWRVTCFACILIGTIWVVWSKEWFWDSNYDLEDQNKTEVLWWCCAIGLTFYIFLTAIQLLQYNTDSSTLSCMLITVLLSICWVYGFLRIGAMTLMLQSFGDAALEAKNALQTTKNSHLERVTSIILTVVWFAAFIAWYPSHVLNALTTLCVDSTLLFMILLGLFFMLFVINLKRHWTTLKIIIAPIFDKDIPDWVPGILAD